jgi:SecD/SecF fusion protein
MNLDAAFIWRRMTKTNIDHSIVILMDNYVYSYPTVIDEIKGGASTITGNYTREEADDLVNILQAGYLPANLKIVKEEEVSPQ